MSPKRLHLSPRHLGALVGMVLALALPGPATALPTSEAGDAPRLLVQWDFFPGLGPEAGADLTEVAPVHLRSPMTAPLLGTPEAQGPGLYRFRADTEPGDSYTLAVPGLRFFGSLRIGGTEYYGAASPRTLGLYQFQATASHTDIVLASRAGGARLEDPGLVPRPILLGASESFSTVERILGGVTILQLGYFLLGGFFILVLYYFWPKNKDFRALALFMLAGGLFSFVRTGSWFGLTEIPRTMASSLYLLAGAALAFSFAHLVSWVFPTRLDRRVRTAAYGIALGLAVISLAPLVLPGTERLCYFLVYGWLVLGSGATLGWLVFRVVAKDGRAAWFLPAFLVLVVALSLQRLLPDSVAAVFFVGPAGLVAFAFVTVLMVVRKVGDSFESSEMLTDYVASVSSTMKRFIPREFLECLNKENVTDLKLGDHVKKKMTIFFSDIRAFTELSEKLTVEENFAFINSYLSRMVPILAENGGFVDKYMGDGIMALFEGDGGPDAAIRAAIAMQEKMVEYNQHRAKMGYRPLAMGVGVHTGDLMLGVIGVDERMENTVISDAVNLSSRLQAITKHFNISLVISEQAFKELDDPGVYKYRFIGKVKVRGKSAPVSVFEIFDGIAPELFERKMKANTYFEQGMLSYYQKDYGGAMYYFKRVLEIIPDDGAAAFYLETCMHKASL